MKQKRVTLANGIALDVVDTGPHSGAEADAQSAPTLIFLHGFPESHRTWRHQIPHLAGRFRCIAPDMRGYRGSSKPQGVENYTADKLIGDVFLLADVLGIERFTIVGHDWGGAIAWGVALGGQHARVERAILCNAPHPQVFSRLLFENRQQREASQYMRAFRDPANDAEIREQGLHAFLQRVAKWEQSAKMEPHERAAQLEDWRDTDAAFAMLNYYRATPLDVPPLDAPYEIPEGWTPPEVPRLTIPTLVVWGMQDAALPPENLAGLREVVDDLTIVEVPESGHFITWEAPEALNAAIDAFLG